MPRTSGRWGKLADVRALDAEYRPHDYSRVVWVALRDGALRYHESKDCAIGGDDECRALRAMLTEARAMKLRLGSCSRCRTL